MPYRPSDDSVRGDPGDDVEGGADTSLRRYFLLVGAVLAGFTALFVVTVAAGVPLLDDPAPMLAGGGAAAAACGVALLIVDVVLPVPSSLVMIAHGALFGVVAGAALSLVGGIGAAVTGYALGRFAGRAAVERVCSATEQARAAHLVQRWGVLAVVVTRPVPLLAETVAVVAGAQRLGPLRTTAAALLGLLPAAGLYAAAGALGWSGPVGSVAFAFVLAIAAAMWLVGPHLSRAAAVRRGPIDVQGGP